MISTNSSFKKRLTNIKEARLLKHSQSNSLIDFKPIRLKSLQEARNALKSSSSRGLLTDLDISLFSNCSTSQCTSQNLSPAKSGLRILVKPKKSWNVENSIVEKVKKEEGSIKPVVVNRKTEVTKRKVLSNSMEVQKKSNIKGLCKPRCKRLSSNSVNESKQNLSISEVLKIMENVKPQKRLTKGQEKGLINRLQNKIILKNSLKSKQH